MRKPAENSCLKAGRPPEGEGASHGARPSPHGAGASHGARPSPQPSPAGEGASNNLSAACVLWRGPWPP